MKSVTAFLERALVYDLIKALIDNYERGKKYRCNELAGDIGTTMVPGFVVEYILYRFRVCVFAVLRLCMCASEPGWMGEGVGDRRHCLEVR